MLPHRRPEADIHEQSEHETHTHADRARLAHAPERQHQRDPFGQARGAARGDVLEAKGHEQAEVHEPQLDRQQDATGAIGGLHD
jgi:hypothetical protein